MGEEVFRIGEEVFSMQENIGEIKFLIVSPNIYVWYTNYF